MNYFVDELEDDNVAIFAGAGLSAGSGFVDWRGLLKDITEKLGLDAKKESDLVSVAQYFLNKNANNRNELNQRILDAFHHGKAPNDNHRILARLPISTYWTTNYDRLIEKSLEDVNKIVDVKITISNLANTVDGRNAILYKMHGDVGNVDAAILSKDQYERYFLTHGPFVTALSGYLVSKTFLFIGFSFEDPNLDYIFSRVRINFENNMRKHYCFFKKVTQNEGESEEDLQYRAVKQSLVIEDLLRFNINVLVVDDYPDITGILSEISARYKRKTIYISGSAHDYGEWSAKEAETLISTLSRSLVRNNYKIVSGFGLGVGSFVINGVLAEVYLNKRENLADQLLLRPFPQGEVGKALWDDYRKDMIAYAGVSIFLFGNKHVDGKTVLADGVRREYEISRDLGLIPIPIPSTGFVAKEIWDDVMASSRHVFAGIEWIVPEIQSLETLGKDVDALTSKVLEIMSKLQERAKQ
ncbi:MAG: SIR2 family protein [Acidobacteria bacterium]|nr:SIR2 family protein [Acidobacteriota bacterium]